MGRWLGLTVVCLAAIAGAAWLVAQAAGDAGPFVGLEDSAATRTLKRGFGHGVTPSDGRLLYDLIVRNRYQRALDIGTAFGYSAIWFGAAMQKTGGQVVTIELDPNNAAIARENFQEAGLAGRIESRIGDALVEIPKLEGEFDFVFMDTGAPLNKRFLDLLRGKLRRGGAVTAHNAGTFLFSQRDFLTAIDDGAAFDTRIVPTTSGGISISVVR